MSIKQKSILRKRLQRARKPMRFRSRKAVVAKRASAPRYVYYFSVAIAEVVNVTRRARSLGDNGFARSESHRLPRALKSFSKNRFLFSGHNLAAAAVAGMTKRQTKFGRRDVNDAGRTTENKID